MKKFYALVSTSETPGGYHILLDGKPVKTPMENSVLVPYANLADEIALEWSAQGEIIEPDSMPLMQLWTTCQEKITRERAALEAAVLKYLDTDLLCYRVEEPEGVCALQETLWDPPLKWFETKFNVSLKTTTGLEALTQAPSVHEKIEDYISNLRDEEFTILQLITPLSGSLVLAVAFIEGEISPEQVLKAARLEEDYRAELYDPETYGPDPMEAKRQKAMQIDLEASAKFLQCAK